MRQIVPSISLIQKIFGQQKKSDRFPYRLTTYCIRLNQPKETRKGVALVMSLKQPVLYSCWSDNVNASTITLACRLAGTDTV